MSAKIPKYASYIVKFIYTVLGQGYNSGCFKWLALLGFKHTLIFGNIYSYSLVTSVMNMVYRFVSTDWTCNTLRPKPCILFLMFQFRKYFYLFLINLLYTTRMLRCSFIRRTVPFWLKCVYGYCTACYILIKSLVLAMDQWRHVHCVWTKLYEPNCMNQTAIKTNNIIKKEDIPLTITGLYNKDETFKLS